MPPISLLTCQLDECGRSFLRALTGDPAHYCSKRCRNRAYYLSHRTEPRVRTRKPRNNVRTDARKEYEREYNQRPEVKERNRIRSRRNYSPTKRPRNPFAHRVLNDTASPYTGHAWLDAARVAVADYVDPTAPWADDRYDEMGEALIALLEGRNMGDAIKEHRRKEFVPRNLMVRISDMGDTDEQRDYRYANLMPSVESAEDEVVARDEVERRIRYHHGSNRPHHKQRQQQPSRRRMQDAGINDKRPRSSKGAEVSDLYRVTS